MAVYTSSTSYLVLLFCILARKAKRLANSLSSTIPFDTNRLEEADCTKSPPAQTEIPIPFLCCIFGRLILALKQKPTTSPKNKNLLERAIAPRGKLSCPKVTPCWCQIGLCPPSGFLLLFVSGRLEKGLLRLV